MECNSIVATQNWIIIQTIDMNLVKPNREYDHWENNTDERILCLNVSKTYLYGKRPNLYECTRKYWRLNGERAKHADLVFAVNSGIIVAVYKPTVWYPSQVMIGRWEFEGEDIKDSPHLLMNISQYLGRRQNPVMYINM